MFRKGYSSCTNKYVILYYTHIVHTCTQTTWYADMFTYAHKYGIKMVSSIFPC